MAGTGVAAKLAAVRDRISRAGADPDRIRVVAVTKGFGIDAVREAVDCGLTDIAENYVQQLVDKASSFPEGIVRWHMIGTVQRNKVAKAAPHVALWQAVDRAAVVDAIGAHAPGAHVLVQVNVSGEPGKAGCTWDEAPDLVQRCVTEGLIVDGLMGVGPHGSPEIARPGFRRLARLADQLGLKEVSAGMSGDLEVAVQEGATIVRLGTALFGPRPARMEE
jgi:pyridoxal phosphate enzyme (YggS family)